MHFAAMMSILIFTVGSSSTAKAGEKLFLLVIGSYIEAATAERYRNRFATNGAFIMETVIHGRIFYRVVMPPTDRSTALQQQALVRKAGFPQAWILPSSIRSSEKNSVPFFITAYALNNTKLPTTTSRSAESSQAIAETRDASKRVALISGGLGQFDTNAIDTGPSGLYFDIGDSAGRHRAAETRLEYRFAEALWTKEYWLSVHPFIGGSVTADGMMYGLGGILFDISAGPFIMTPGIGVGLWRRGGGKDLGHPVQFRTMFELGYRFDDETRVSIGFSHMSNANFSKKNPGSNSLIGYFHMPYTN